MENDNEAIKLSGDRIDEDDISIRKVRKTIAAHQKVAVAVELHTILKINKSDTTINPQDNATRVEMTTILQRFIESVK